jgi:hypothetical protein
MSFVFPVLHVTQVVLTIYTLNFSYASISALIGGDLAQRVANYSNKAALRVFHARGTQTAGAVSLTTSLLLSLYLVASTLGVKAGSSTSGTKAVLELAEMAGITATYFYVGNFWSGRAKVPSSRADSYNAAITTTGHMKINLGYLAMLWAVSGGLELGIWAKS